MICEAPSYMGDAELKVWNTYCSTITDLRALRWKNIPRQHLKTSYQHLMCNRQEMPLTPNPSKFQVQINTLTIHHFRKNINCVINDPKAQKIRLNEWPSKNFNTCINSFIWQEYFTLIALSNRLIHWLIIIWQVTDDAFSMQMWSHKLWSRGRAWPQPSSSIPRNIYRKYNLLHHT